MLSAERAAALRCVAASGDNLCVVTGAANSTGRLVAGQLVAKLGGDNVVLVVPDGQQDSYWPVEMPDDIVLSGAGPNSPFAFISRADPLDQIQVTSCFADVCLWCSRLYLVLHSSRR